MIVASEPSIGLYNIESLTMVLMLEHSFTLVMVANIKNISIRLETLT
jgi:hypothetical protein